MECTRWPHSASHTHSAFLMLVECIPTSIRYSPCILYGFSTEGGHLVDIPAGHCSRDMPTLPGLCPAEPLNAFIQQQVAVEDQSDEQDIHQMTVLGQARRDSTCLTLGWRSILLPWTCGCPWWHNAAPTSGIRCRCAFDHRPI